MKVRENLWQVMKIWKSMKSMNMYGIYLSWTKKVGYIPYSNKINASHICPPKRSILFKQREWKLRFSGKHGLWPAKYISQSLFWWKHEMIPWPIQTFCPRRFSIQPQEKFSFWQKCWNLFFQKSGIQLLSNIRQFEPVSAAKLMTFGSKIDH